MTEEKIRIKDLLSQINVPSKDIMRALRELKLQAKSPSGSLSPEEAGRLLEYFNQQKKDSVERTEVQPNVVVRRRRKETAGKPEVTRTAKPVEVGKDKDETEKKAVEEKVSPAVATAKEPERAETVEKPAEPRAQQKERPSRKALRNVGARVISRPTVIKEPEPVKQPEEPKKPEPVEPPRKTLAQEIREREALAREQAKEEARALKRKIERGASIISKPVAEVPATPVTEKAKEPVKEKAPEPEEPRISPVLQAVTESMAREKKEARPARTGQGQHSGRAAMRQVKPEASAQPGSSATPTFAQKISEPGADSANARIVKPAAPRVNVISRPSPAATQTRKARPASTGGDNTRGERTQQPRNQGNRYSGAQKERGGTPYGGQMRTAPTPIIFDQNDGREGQSKKKRLKGRRTVDFQQGDFGRHPEEEEGMHFKRSKPRRKTAKVQQQSTQPLKATKRKIRVSEAIRVADMAHQLGVKATEIIKVLFGLGVMATINQSLDIDTATLVAAEFGYEVEKAGFSEEDYLTPKETDTPESLKPRPPVVTIMGHVDHGKTSLLDAIRKTHVTSGEAGGITQHIGAYHVKTKRGEIVFLDTPGHEAFTAMRARGAQITDLVVLVVAADDGVMEQTREAISHSRAANVPIMVAVNKMDKPGADPDRVLRELSELGLQPEEWGGDTIVAKVSAKTHAGLDDFLELVALQSEIMDLKANPDKPARGHIVEAKLDRGRGPVATVLIQEGTLHLGDNFVCGPFAGRVRALMNDQGKKVKEAGPSIPVEVQGFDGVPDAGEQFLVVADDKIARRIADSRAIKRRERDLASESGVTLETFLAHHADQEIPVLNLVVKADVQGSIGAITEALQKQSTEKVKINIVHSGAGAISESDILLAAASKAIIIGFNVRPTARIKDIAEKENVDIRFYDIIYKLIDDVKSAMAGLLAPVQREVYLGQAEVRKVYNLPKIGAIAGSYVADGKIVRNVGIRVLRDGIVVHNGKIASLKRFKDDAREVVKGNECGIGLENFNDIKVGDIIEAFETVQEAATL